MIHFPLRISPVGQARFGAHWCPPSSALTVPRARLSEKAVLPEVTKPPLPALLVLWGPASVCCPSFVSSMCVCRTVACVPAASLSQLLCADNREGEPSVCRSHLSRLIIHLQAALLQTPCTCSRVLTAGAAAGQPHCCGEKDAGCSPQPRGCLPHPPGPSHLSSFPGWADAGRA